MWRIFKNRMFILGMYENNTAGMWHTFFAVDYRDEGTLAYITFPMADL